MITGLTISSAILLIILGVSVYFNYKFGIIILSVQDNVEDCLEVLDERYTSMSLILEKPVFFDSIEVRQVINDISISRDSILYVANRLSSIDKTKEEIE